MKILVLFLAIVLLFGCSNDAPTSYTSRAETDTILVDEFSFDFREYNFYESATLEYGTEYMLEVSGTFAVALRSSPDRDARYVFDPQTNEETDSLYDSDGTFAWDDGDGIFPENFDDYNRKPIPNEYSPDHIYYFYFVSDGTTEIFMFKDGGGYGDNSGKLYFVLFSLPDQR